MLQNENQLPRLSESALKVKVGGVAQDMWQMAFYLFYSFLKSESQIWQNWFDQLGQYGNTVQTGQLPSMTQYAVRKDRMHILFVNQTKWSDCVVKSRTIPYFGFMALSLVCHWTMYAVYIHV